MSAQFVYRREHFPNYSASIDFKNHFRCCLKCDEYYPLSPCTNCGGHNRSFGKHFNEFSDGTVKCDTCEKEWSSWICPKCECDNPYHRTLYKRVDLVEEKKQKEAKIEIQRQKDIESQRRAEEENPKRVIVITIIVVVAVFLIYVLPWWAWVIIIIGAALISS